MPVIYAIAMTAMLGFGVSVLRINSRRRVNQIFAGICFICFFYFAFTLVSRYYAHIYRTTGVYKGLPWVRLTWTTTACMPLYLWCLYYVVSGNYQSRRELLIKLAPWFTVSGLLIAITWTQLFITDANLPDKRTPGFGFWLFQIVLVIASTALLVSSLVLAPKLRGIRKLEFQYLTLNCGALSVLAVLLPLITPLPTPLRKLVTIPIVCYGISGWSIATHRVYESRHIYLALFGRALVYCGAGFAALWAISLTDAWESNAYAKVAIIGLFCLGAYYADEALRRFLQLKPEQRMLAARQQLLAHGETETDPLALLRSAEGSLSRWTETTRVTLLVLQGDAFVGGEMNVPLSALRQAEAFAEGWVTPASLSRTRPTPGNHDLAAQLSSGKLGAIAAGSWREAAPAVICAVDERENELPFTYPEITRLRELVEVVDGLYKQAVLRLQSRQADQLAAIGRLGASLAHEMRNPTLSLRTFARMLPTHARNEEFIARFAHLVPQEAERVHALAEQLLDMARPRNYEFALVDVHSVIADTIKLLEPRASESATRLTSEFTARDSTVMADTSALRQILINLIYNSIEALERRATDRLVSIRTHTVDERLVIEVEDNGPGIPEKMRLALFSPFATAGKKGGMGLGLSICADLVRVHRGAIVAAESSLGGARFRIELPVSTHNASPPSLH